MFRVSRPFGYTRHSSPAGSFYFGAAVEPNSEARKAIKNVFRAPDRRDRIFVAVRDDDPTTNFYRSRSRSPMAFNKRARKGC